MSRRGVEEFFPPIITVGQAVLDRFVQQSGERDGKTNSEVISHYTRLLAQPDRRECHHRYLARRASAKSRGGDLAGAFSDFKESLLLKEDYRTYAKLAHLYHALKQGEAALKAIDAALGMASPRTVVSEKCALLCIAKRNICHALGKPFDEVVALFNQGPRLAREGGGERNRYRRRVVGAVVIEAVVVVQTDRAAVGPAVEAAARFLGASAVAAAEAGAAAARGARVSMTLFGGRNADARREAWREAEEGGHATAAGSRSRR